MGEISEKQKLINEIFRQYDVDGKEELSAEQLQEIHADMRIGGISIPQVQAALKFVCVGDGCENSELFDVLQEMDRRYFLLQDLRWEFSMLDAERKDTISEVQARWLMEAVHNPYFLKRKWNKFLKCRAVPGSGVSFAEIEVELCNIPSVADFIRDEEEERLEEEERERRRRELEEALERERLRLKRKRDEERKRKDEEERRRLDDEAKRRKEEEEENLKRRRTREEEERRRRKLEEDEERGSKEAEEREKRERRLREEEERRRREDEEFQEQLRLQRLEEQRKREEEERRRREEKEAKNDEKVAKNAEEKEREAEEELERAMEAVRKAKDGKSKKEAEDEEQRVRLKFKDNRNKRIRFYLKVAIKKRDRPKLEFAVDEFKKARLPDDEGDLAKAEKILMEFRARDGLRKAIKRRNLKELESAMDHVKRNNLEIPLADDMLEANELALRLRRLERIRAEILELKQSTVAEIRSYQKPPPQVHIVMTATFLVLGHKEKETKDWKTVQALVGKTGKEGLKRRCLECEPEFLDVDCAARAHELLKNYELDDIRDVSAGAATFYLWAVTMVEEYMAIQEQKKKEEKERIIMKEKKKKEAEERKKAEAERKKMEEEKRKLQAENQGVDADITGDGATGETRAPDSEDQKPSEEAELKPEIKPKVNETTTKKKDAQKTKKSRSKSRDRETKPAAPKEKIAAGAVEALGAQKAKQLGTAKWVLKAGKMNKRVTEEWVPVKEGEKPTQKKVETEKVPVDQSTSQPAETKGGAETTESKQ